MNIMEVIQLIPFYKIPKILTVYVSERRDLNPRPPLPQSGNDKNIAKLHGILEA